MEINKALEDIKQEILLTIIQIERAKSIRRRNQLIKHKHRLEKQVMTYMGYRYGIIMKKGD